MDESEYIKKRVAGLQEGSQELFEVAEGVSNDFDTWSALKLILHSAATNMYTSVHESQETGDIFYIDALSGSGVSKFEAGRCFLGSPLIAARSAQRPFSKMYFIESNDRYRSALRDRLNYAFRQPGYTEPDEWEIFDGDANDEIGNIVKEIQAKGSYEDKYNYYCFIDNQGLDVNWGAMEDLTPKPYGDILVNLPTYHAIGRNAPRESTKALMEFYGTDFNQINTRHNVRDQMHKLYCKRLADRGREVQESTQVNTDVGSFYFDLVYATRYIPNGNGYMRVIAYVKEFIESVHGGDINRILDVLDGNQDVIGSYLPDKEIEDELPDPDPQKGLGDFS